MFSSIAKSFKAGILITLVVFCVGLGISQTSFMQKNEWVIYDWLMQLNRQNTTLPDNIVVILVDDISLKTMDPVVGRWPWPRSVFADIIDFIALGSPQAILVDIIFGEKSDVESGDDQRLSLATQQAGTVYHAMQFITDEPDEYNINDNNPLPTFVQEQFSYNNLDNKFNNLISSSFNNYIIPIGGLFQNAKGLGVVAFNKDVDGVHRRTQLIYDYQGHWYPSLSVSALSKPMEQLPIRFLTSVSQLVDQSAQKTMEPAMVNMYGDIKGLSMSGVLDSIVKLQNGEVDKLIINPQEFNNKYVFIGTSAAGLYDLKTTPLTTNSPGVYLHASLLGNLLNNDLLAPIDYRLNLLTLFVAVLLTIFGVLHNRHLSAQIVAPFVVMLVVAVIVYISYQYNWVMNVASPILTICLAWAVSFSYLLFSESKDKKRLKSTFSRYLSPAALTVIENDYENYLTVNVGSKETGTILFCDIRGFTSFSESQEAQQVVDFLNYYFSTMTKVIHEHNGAIDKFIGDAIMAYWGIPVKTKTHAVDAVNAAVKMVSQLNQVNNWLRAKDLEDISIGIGIHTGDVILGSIGSEDRADFTIIGDNVNLASRLEGATKFYKCPIILSESIYTIVKGRIPCRLIDAIKVKGKSQPVKIYTPFIGLSEFEGHRLQHQVELAFSCYMQCQWDAAISYYQSLPNHPINQIIIERCKTYKSQPPPQNWDGTYSMMSK